MAIYTIGDIQGCYEPLRKLLDSVHFDPSSDRLWFVGDLVNRGPRSLDVLRYVRGLGDAATVVLGNHDLHLIMQAEGFGKANAEDTFDDVINAPDSEELLAWLRHRPLFHVEGHYAMVHAGLLPDWTVDKASALSDEVRVALGGTNYREFLANMWGSEPTRWSDELVGWDRLRVIVNAMTRMRYCREGGAMEFRVRGAKNPPEQAPEGCIPWYALPGRASADHTIVFGHWSALGYRRHPDLISLDSGCLWGGSLTAVRLMDRQAFQVRCPAVIEPDGWE
jgi:bis(5'-nucleosyl)-tetraphosphatase (symmetrical)